MPDAWLSLAAGLGGGIISGAFGGSLSYEYRLRRDSRVESQRVRAAALSCCDAIQTVCGTLEETRPGRAGIQSLRNLVIQLSDDMTRLLSILGKRRGRDFQLQLLAMNSLVEGMQKGNARQRAPAVDKLAAAIRGLL